MASFDSHAHDEQRNLFRVFAYLTSKDHNMIKRCAQIARVLGLATFLLGGASIVLASQHNAFTPSQEEAIDKRIRAYLLENPDLIVEALRILEQRQTLAEARRSREQLASRQEEILNDPASPVGWNLDGDVTIVEFFDYQCPYCKAVVPRLNALRSEDDGIRYVYKELPILGPVSVIAARAALASREQDRYEDFHEALMTRPGKIRESDIFIIAEEVGLDIAQLRDDMRAPGIEESIERTRQLATALGINGTPAFVIGDRLVPGAISLEQLRSLVRRARERS